MIRFGTGGWREIIGDGFTKVNIRRVACALARRMQREGVENEGLCIGYDRRFLSRESAIWFSEVMAGEGVKLYFVYNGAQDTFSLADSSGDIKYENLLEWKPQTRQYYGYDMWYIMWSICSTL